MNLAGNITKLKKYFDCAYLIALVLYVACYACNQTAVSFPFWNVIIGISSFFLMAVAVYRLISILADNIKKPLYAVVIFLAAFLIFALYIYSLVAGEIAALIILPYALIGAMGINADQILYSCIGGNLLMVVQNIVIILTGSTNDLTEDRDFFYLGNNVFKLHRLNSKSLTNLSSHWFWIIAAYLWIRGKKITWLEILALSALDFFVYSLSASNTSLVTITLLVLIAALIKVYSIIDDKTLLNKNNLFVGFSKFVSVCLRYLFVVIAAGCIGLSLAFNTGSPLMFRLDSILHNRLAYGYRGIMEYGINILPFDIPSYGVDRSADGYYFFLDNSYLSLLIRYGVIFLVFYVMCMTYILNRYKKYTYGALILCVCAFACVEEPRLFELPYNFFILLLLADKNIDDKFVANAEKVKRNKGIILKVCSAVICIGLLIGVFFVNYPRYKAVKKMDALDQNACYIYSAVQKNIDAAIASGEWNELLANNSSYQLGDLLSKPSDYSSVNGIAWSEAISNPKIHSYYSVPYGVGSDSFAVNDILISDEVKNFIGNGSVVIEYDAVSGKVYSVWYSESSGCVAIDDGRDNTRAGRLRDGVVPEGYYAGGVNG